MSNVPHNSEFDADEAFAEVKAQLDALNGEHDAPAAVSRETPNARPMSELDRINSTCHELYRTKRRQLLELESRHALDRAKLEDSYRMSLAELEHEAREALRALDRSFEAEHRPLADLVRRLEDMRE